MHLSAMQLKILILTLTWIPAQGFNILAFFPISFKSHIVPFQTLLLELAKRGHQVTELSSFPPLKTHSNYHFKKTPFSFPNTDLSKLIRTFHTTSGPSIVRLFSNYCLIRSTEALELSEVQHFIKNNESHFDVIFVEGTFCGESFLSLGHKYDAPVINFHPLGYTPSKFYYLMGNLLSPLTNPDFRLPITDRMSAYDMLLNTFTFFLDLYDAHYYYYPKIEEQMEKSVIYRGVESRPNLYDLMRNISMTFIEYDPMVGLVYPVAPNLIFTGGLQLKDAEKLPQYLENFMNDAQHGVIYLSMGSNLQFSHLSQYVTDAFKGAFSRIKYKVIWKLDIETKDISSNVLVGNWFPQNDIIGHKNCKLFITHGGIHSAMESSYHGVPVVMMPGFSDQFQNVRVMANLGMGVIIDMDTITENMIVSAIEEVINNSTYKANMVRISKYMRTAPMSSLEKAISWTEFIAENKGAPILRPYARNFSLFETLGLELLYYSVGIFLATITLFILLYLYAARRTKHKIQ